jgi:molybdopterin converting factor small subunit
MPVVRIPSVLRKHTGGQAKVEADGDTVREVFARLTAQNPELEQDLLDGDQVRRFINVYVDDEDIRYVSGLDTPVEDDTEIAIMPAVAGGAGGAEAAERPSGG